MMFAYSDLNSLYQFKADKKYGDSDNTTLAHFQEIIMTKKHARVK